MNDWAEIKVAEILSKPSHEQASLLAAELREARAVSSAALVAAEERGRVAVLSESGVLATYEDQVSDSAPGLRKWWSGGTWLYPGDKIIEVRTAAESAARGERGEK